MIMDAIFGEPKWLWSRTSHPVVLMGKLVGWCDQKFNHGSSRKLAGIMACGSLVIGAGALGQIIGAFPDDVIDMFILAIMIAHKSLVQHVKAVANGLRLSLNEGRHTVAMIVSRDTDSMDQSAVARSAIESAAENLSDGVIAPVFWFVIAGLPGLFIYKIVNTADSMIGYMTPQYRDFGWAAARLDDLLNIIPARLTALLLWLPHSKGAWSDIAKDARMHKSPNAGWPEAAMAYALDVALAGPRSYAGTLQDFPYVNPQGKQILGPNDIDRASTLLWQAWAIVLMVALVGGLSPFSWR
jgi:adenosylcobinamide-phosphate synthase